MCTRRSTRAIELICDGMWRMVYSMQLTYVLAASVQWKIFPMANIMGHIYLLISYRVKFMKLAIVGRFQRQLNASSLFKRAQLREITRICKHAKHISLSVAHMPTAYYEQICRLNALIY